MNEMKSMEEQLQSWTLRRPSPELRDKLFGRAERETPASQNRSLLWFMPTAACLMAALITLKVSDHSQILNNATSSSPGMFAMLASNSVTFPLDGDFSQENASTGVEWNVWSNVVCKSTNEQAWNANSNNSPSRPMTNLLQ